MTLIYPKDLCHLLLESDNFISSMIDFTQPVYTDQTFNRSDVKMVEEDNVNRAAKLYCNRCGEITIEYFGEIEVDKDVLFGIHVIMYHPAATRRLSRSLSSKYPYLNLNSRFNKFVCSKCSIDCISLEEFFEHARVHVEN